MADENAILWWSFTSWRSQVVRAVLAVLAVDPWEYGTKLDDPFL